MIGDKLRLVTTADEFGEKLNWIKQVVKETNKGIDKHIRAVRIEEETDKSKMWEEKAIVEMMKEALRKRCI